MFHKLLSALRQSRFARWIAIGLALAIGLLAFMYWFDRVWLSSQNGGHFRFARADLNFLRARLMEYSALMLAAVLAGICFALGTLTAYVAIRIYRRWRQPPQATPR